MPSPADRTASAYGQAVPLRRRLASFAIALAINVLLLLMLIFMSPSLPGSKNGEGHLFTFNVNDSNEDKAASGAKPKQVQVRATKATATTTTKAPKATVAPPIVPVQPHQPNMILMTHDEFAASDISKLPNHATEMASAGAGSTSGASSGEGDTPTVGGKGPHGEPLYAAEWYRRPTDAEMRPYEAKAHIPDGGTADIACRTIARFHVEDCMILGDPPPGSHLGNAIQSAAFQFLIRPPRVGGKSLVGAWVRIHYTVTIIDKPTDGIGP